MLPSAFYHFKSTFSSLLPFSADALHVHIALFLFIAVAALVKSESRRFAIAFGVVLVICLAGELLDVLYDLGAGNPIRWRNGIKDVVNTMLWPAVWAVIGTQLGRRNAAAASDAARPEPPRGLSREPR